MLKDYYLDVGTSRRVYEANKSKIKVKDCYHNIYRLLLEPKNTQKFRSGVWKVAYGVVPVGELMIRHCFIVQGNKAIDPTLFAREISKDALKDRVVYKAFKIFDMDSYFNAVIKNSDYPDLVNYLRREADSAFKELYDAGYYMIG